MNLNPIYECRPAANALTIEQFCERVGITKPTYFRLRAEGRGPREMRPRGSLVRISTEAYRDWVRSMETEDSSAHRAKLKRRSDAANAGAR